MAKNLVSSLNTFVAVDRVHRHGAVSWPPTLAMMAGCLVGGFCGAHLARVRPAGGRCGSWWSWSARLLTAIYACALWTRRQFRPSASADPMRVASPAATSRLVIALPGSVIGSQTVKWFMPGDRLVARLDALARQASAMILLCRRNSDELLAADHGVEHAAASAPARTAARSRARLGFGRA